MDVNPSARWIVYAGGLGKRDALNARGGGKSGDIRAFEAIAMEASHRQVVERLFAAVLPGDYMIDLEGEPVMWIRDPAVLTTMYRPLPDLANQMLVHGFDDTGNSDFRWRRAFD